MKSLKKDEINKLCKRCKKSCKQSKDIVLISCPNFKPMPVQLEFSFYKRTKKK